MTHEATVLEMFYCSEVVHTCYSMEFSLSDCGSYTRFTRVYTTCTGLSSYEALCLIKSAIGMWTIRRSDQPLARLCLRRT